MDSSTKLHCNDSDPELLERITAAQIARTVEADEEEDSYTDVKLRSPATRRSSGSSRHRRASKISRSSSSGDEDWPGVEIPLTERAPRGTATRERRRQQNRIAQRSLRERKEAHVKNLERVNVLQQKELARVAYSITTSAPSAQTTSAQVGTVTNAPAYPDTIAAAMQSFESARDAIIAAPPLAMPFVIQRSHESSSSLTLSHSASSGASQQATLPTLTVGMSYAGHRGYVSGDSSIWFD